MAAFKAVLVIWSMLFFPKVVISRQQIDIAVMVPQDTRWLFAIPRVDPAIEVALETLYNKTDIISNLDIRVRYADSKCDVAYGIDEAFNFYLHKHVDVYFGPCCDYAAAPVARQIRFWNLPMVTAGAMAGDFGTLKKSMYPLLTRVGTNFNSLARLILDILETFNWNAVKLIYQPEGQNAALEKFCHFTADGIHRGITLQGKQIRQDYFKFSQPSDINLETEIGNQFGIVVICASPDAVRDIMIKADELNFDNGEYVFFNIDLFSSESQIENAWYRENDTDARNEKARKAYEALMTITLRRPDSKEYRIFSNEVKKRAKLKYGDSIYGQEDVNSFFVGAFHDAVFLYALALNETIAAGYDASNGTAVTNRMWNRTFEGITGTVSIDEIGDRNSDYSILDLNPDHDSKFEVVANYYGNRKVYETVEGRKIHWPKGRIDPPPDTPECGFDGSGCPPDEPFPEYAIVIIVLSSMLLIVSLSAFFVYGHYRRKADLAEINWRVRWDDIRFGAVGKRKLERSGSRMSLNRRGSYSSQISTDSMADHLKDNANKQIFTKTGYYKGALIALKKIKRANVNITKPLLVEFKRMRDLQNDHIVRFIGICIDSPNHFILTEYCQKGSLQDVLENDQLKLDNMFKFSLMQDIVRGLAYLHNSDIKSHGNLKSSNCVVDSRFVLKITDFGIHSLRGQDDNDEEDTYQYYRGKLWTPPELLRLHNPPPEGTQKGDIYSFAIICQEIAYRQGAFYVENLDLSPQEIYRKVKNGQRPYFRPTLDHLGQFDEGDDLSEELSNMIKKCWAEDPMERPDSHSLKSIIRKINKEGDSGNILDNLLARMEQYANNLETLVEERTADYLEEKKRAEDLLYMMLPKSVACQLMQGESVTAEKFESCTIYFSDIVGFTALSSGSTPMQVVDLLNDLYTAFDSIIDSYDCYKVETIGDAYMVVSGIPSRNGDLHAREVARVSLGLLNAVKSFKIRHRPDAELRLRIGIHTGSAVAGVVGLKMPRYCLFGDTVNTASRMESNGEPLRIHVSPFTKDILDKFGTFKLELRGPVDMKGKGKIVTWWLLGEENNPENPDFAPKEAY